MSASHLFFQSSAAALVLLPVPHYTCMLLLMEYITSNRYKTFNVFMWQLKVILKQLYFAADQTTNFSIYHKSLYTSYTIISLLFFISSVFFYYRTSHGVLLSQQRLLASYGSEKILKSDHHGGSFQCLSGLFV